MNGEMIGCLIAAAVFGFTGVRIISSASKATAHPAFYKDTQAGRSKMVQDQAETSAVQVIVGVVVLGIALVFLLAAFSK
jgi:hypothetical protein